MTVPDQKRQCRLTGRHLVENVKSNVAVDDRIALPAAAQDGEKFPPYGREVSDALKSGKTLNVYIFCGEGAWDRAKQRRKTHGNYSALVLPQATDPLGVHWPAVPEIIVSWPGGNEFDRKLTLAQALIRDGVRIAHIEHSPEWIRARAKAVA